MLGLSLTFNTKHVDIEQDLDLSSIEVLSQITLVMELSCLL